MPITSDSILIAIALLFSTIDAFHVSFTKVPPSRIVPRKQRNGPQSQNTCSRGRSPLLLYAVSPEQDGFDFDGTNKDDSDFDVEAARQRLESLLVGNVADNEGVAGQSSITATDDQQRQHQHQHHLQQNNHHQATVDPPEKVLPAAPPLTTIQRERRETEIDLLHKLVEGDEVLSDLWTLWFHERGPEAAQRLLQAEELTNLGARGWGQAEFILKELIEEYGVHFAEPVHRLATLYFLAGRLKEAEELCKIVLSVKPWHFGALSNIVMVYAANHDSNSARNWAARRLPAFAQTGPNRRRMAWVQKAAANARDALEAAEQRIIEAFEKSDDGEHSSNLYAPTDTDLHFNINNGNDRSFSQQLFDSDDGNAWQ